HSVRVAVAGLGRRAHGLVEAGTLHDQGDAAPPEGRGGPARADGRLMGGRLLLLLEAVEDGGIEGLLGEIERAVHPDALGIDLLERVARPRLLRDPGEGGDGIEVGRVTGDDGAPTALQDSEEAEKTEVHQCVQLADSSSNGQTLTTTPL